MLSSQSTKARFLLTLVITMLMALVLGAGQADAGPGRDHRRQVHEGHKQAHAREARREVRQHRREIREHKRKVRKHTREIREHRREIRRHQREVRQHRHAQRRHAHRGHRHYTRHRYHRHYRWHGWKDAHRPAVYYDYHYYPRQISHRPAWRHPIRYHLSAAGRCNAGLAGSLVGGGVGAALGTLADDDVRPAAIAGGAVAGILVGSIVGHAIDASDRGCMGETLNAASDGSTIVWNNPRTATSHSLTPTRSYETRNGRYCREFVSTATIGNRDEEVYGTACWQPDGSWEVVRTQR